MKNRILFIFLIFVLNSCEKEFILEKTTIEPQAYFPAYPGSYWKYFDNFTNDTVLLEVEPEYKLHTYLSDNNNCLPTDSTYVPVIDGIPYYGYKNPKYLENYYSTPNCDKLTPFLGEYLGKILEFDSSFTYSKKNEIWVNSFLDTMTVRGVLYNDIIEVKQLYYYYSTLKSDTRYYYSKNIGRIKTLYLLDINDSLEGKSLELIEYNINH